MRSEASDHKERHRALVTMSTTGTQRLAAVSFSLCALVPFLLSQEKSLLEGDFCDGLGRRVPASTP